MRIVLLDRGKEALQKFALQLSLPLDFVYQECQKFVEKAKNFPSHDDDSSGSEDDNDINGTTNYIHNDYDEKSNHEETKTHSITESQKK